MDALTRHCAHLEELYLSDCTRITDASMRYIAASMRRLRALEIDNCSRVTDAGTHAIVQHCPLLCTFVKPS